MTQQAGISEMPETLKIGRSAPDDQVMPLPARTSDDDRGSSLIEILIAVFLTGTLVLAVVNAISVGVGASSGTFASAETSTVLLNAGDRVARAPQLCDYEQYVDAAALSENWDPALVSASVERLVANTGAPSDWAPQTCPDDVNPFDVQRVTITVTSPGGQVTKSITVVKSDVS